MPNVLRGVGDIDLSVTVMGQRLALPVYCSPRLFSGYSIIRGNAPSPLRRASTGRCSASRPLGTVSLEEARRISGGPQVYQFYFHKDRGLNRER